MITGIDVKQTIDFISAHDKSEPKTIWKLGLLSYKAFLKLGGMSDQQDTQNAIVEAVRHGLKGVENYTSAQFAIGSDGLVSESFLKTIPPVVLIEIGSKIMSISTLKEDETKN